MTARSWTERTTLTAALTILTLGALVAPPAMAESTHPSPARPRLQIIDPQLRAQAESAPDGAQVEYLVSLDASPDLDGITFDRAAVVAALKDTAERSQRPVVAHLRSQGAEVLNTFWLTNAVLARSSAEAMTSVTAIASVEAILPMTEVELPEPAVEPLDQMTAQTVDDHTWGIDRIGAHRVWTELGLDGTGIRVATLDTGVDITHPDLAGQMVSDDPNDPRHPGGWIEFDAAGHPVPSEPHDSQWHGTHVSGTIHGRDNLDGGTAIGVAPGADLMHALVLPEGSGTVAQIIAGMQWAVEPYDHEGNPAGQPANVVNMSFGPQSGGIIDAFAEPIRNMYFAGVLPVAAAGNCGDGCHGSPGNVVESLSIGATDDADDVATFSSGGVVEAGDWAQPPADWPDRWTVPDVSAPGVDVVSSVPPGTFDNDPDAIFGRASGTSMASPHTAATAALMLSGDPTVPIEEIADILIDTSYFDERHGAQRPNTRFGHGRIDAFQAVSRIAIDSGVLGTVTDAATGEPVSGATVDVVGLDVSIRTGADGGYEFRLQPGRYTLEFSWSGHVIATAPDVVVTEGELTVADVPLSGVAGLVTDAGSGEPVPDVAVAVAETGVTVDTDAEGRFRHYLAPGTYTLEASWSGHVVATVPDVVVAERNIANVDVSLGGVAGLVTNAGTGDPVADVTVEVLDLGLSATTGADGMYRFYLAEDSYGLRFSSFGYEETLLEGVDVADGSLTTADVPLVPLPVGSITGTVTLGISGLAVPGVTVMVNGTPLEATTGADGMYTITAPVGSYSIATRAALFPAAHAQDVVVEVGGSATMDFVLECGAACQLDELWTARYDGSEEIGEPRQAGANAMGISPDGSRLYVTGASNVTGTRTDYATVAYDTITGEQLWSARYNGPSPGRAAPTALAVSPDGSRVLVTGGSNDVLSLRGDFATVAYDAMTGDELWAARYDGPSDLSDVATSVRVSPDGSRVFVAGQSPDATGVRDYATLAYDAVTGEQLWVSRFNGAAGGQDVLQDLGVSDDGTRIFVTGFITTTDAGWDFGTVAYDAVDGEQLWVARYDGPASRTDQAGSMAVSADAVIVVGPSEGVGTNFDYATVAYDPVTGEQRWASRYDGPRAGFDRPEEMAVSPDGSRVYVTGESTGDGFGFAPRDFATVAYDTSDGGELWAARHAPSPGRDAGTDVGVSPDGSRVFVTGLSLTAAAGTDYVTLAYAAADGQAIWAGQYDGPANDADFPNALVVSPDGDRVFVAGHSRSSPAPGFGEPGFDTGVDFATVAYDATADDEFPVFVPYDLQVEPPAALRGAPVSVGAAIANVGIESGDYDAILLVDGEPQEAISVTLDPHEATRIEWTVTLDGLGSYEIRLGHLVGQLDVVEASYEFLRGRIESLQADGQITKAGAVRLLAGLRQAEHHLANGAAALAAAALQRFCLVAGDARFVPGAGARQELLIGADELLAQLE